ncbi:hypothetical protein K7432_009274 [Basidiobolus ranarum]|uniref:Uncharacterized protein n=1 Tax=Basidiobolus ranarum TaxID=34480 RepID=A0ABR2WQJ1_9FUNG
MSRGIRSRGLSKERESGAEKSGNSNKKGAQNYTSLIPSNCSIPKRTKSPVGTIEPKVNSCYEQTHLLSPGSNHPLYTHQSEENSRTSNNNLMPPNSVGTLGNKFVPDDKVKNSYVGQGFPSLTLPSPMGEKTQMQPRIGSPDHSSNLYDANSHCLSIPPRHSSPSTFSQRSNNTPFSSSCSYQGFRTASNAECNLEATSFDAICRDSSVSSHSNDGNGSLHSTQKSDISAGNESTTETLYLQEKNQYLEARVKGLEAELIHERLTQRDSEWLEERVKELEIEKSLLKSLLIERDEYSSGLSAVSSNRNLNDLPQDTLKLQ